MAVTMEQTGNPVFPWRVRSECVTKAEAFAKAARIEEINPEAFQPLPVQHHAIEAPMPPHVEEIIAAAEAGDDEPGALKAGEAYREHADGAA